ncbi:DUF1007 family protein [Rhizobium sp. PAMB 3182]
MKKIALTAFICLLPLSAFAHPHVFADAKLEVVEGPNKTLLELKHTWYFDEVFSSSVMMDYDKNTDLKLEPDELADISNTVVNSLADYSYYTLVTVNGKDVVMAHPHYIKADFKDNRLLITFAIKPERPLPLKGNISVGAYDPSLYTALDFASDSDFKLDGKDLNACKHAVIRPDPDQIISQNQASLTDSFFSDPTTIPSKLVATRLDVTC